MSATVVQLAPYLTEREEGEKIERAEIDAGWYFDKATRAQKAEYDATMRNLIGVVGPRWNRERDAAKAKFAAETAEARALFDRTVESLLETGEVSQELDDEWTALFDLQTVGAMMAAE